MEMVDIIAKLQADEEFAKKLEQAETIPQIQEILREYGVELSAEQIIHAASVSTSDELSDADLDAINGGANNLVAWFAELFSGFRKTCNYSPIDGMVCKPKKKKKEKK